MIKMESVSYQYPKSSFQLSNVSLEIKKGECTALCGKNGSGKTTIAKLMAGIIRPEVGRILIAGENTATMSLGKIGTKVGFLFQEPSRQLFAVTVEEELTFAEIIKGKSEQKAKEKARELLQCFGMENMLQNTVQNLSRGEKQRLAICALLCCEPEFLILDEPTSGLDDESIAELSEIIDQLIKKGVGIVLISHDHEFIKRHRTRIIKVEGGKIYGE